MKATKQPRPTGIPHAIIPRKPHPAPPDIPELDYETLADLPSGLLAALATVPAPAAPRAAAHPGRLSSGVMHRAKAMPRPRPCRRSDDSGGDTACGVIDHGRQLNPSNDTVTEFNGDIQGAWNRSASVHRAAPGRRHRTCHRAAALAFVWSAQDLSRAGPLPAGGANAGR